MSSKIIEIEGIGAKYAEKFVSANVRTVEELLQVGSSKAGREKLATQTGIDEKRILSFCNMADLFRIKGVGSEFAELLEAAGVDTVKELRNRVAENLHAKLVEVNNGKNLVRQVPSLSQVKDFIAQAQQLDPVLTH
ncbi:MAG: DUF4332 domain-containing protein [Ferruginibacter sp.]|nr:DUF4332 domain-containing protein [Cytophagales bacterium]